MVVVNAVIYLSFLRHRMHSALACNKNTFENHKLHDNDTANFLSVSFLALEQ